MYNDLGLTIQSEIPIDIDLGITSEIELTISEGGTALPVYDGDYVVVPRKVEQVLETKNKSMRENVTINPINYLEVSNPQGGKTATIGYE